MKNFDTRVYSISDFLEWHNNALLELSPDFQRRTVWSEKAKSYLIDTIVRGRPIPKILISQRLDQARTVRVVVDGQQRLRAILEYINGDFPISRAHNTQVAGKRFNTLSSDMQKEFLKYELGVDLLFNLSYEDILDIFTRINSYTVTLNKQELLNAKYLGYFKQCAYHLGLKYVSYFLRAGVLTKARVTRMAEAELSSDLLTSIVGGVQTNKSVEQFYKKYADQDLGLQQATDKFDNTMSHIGELYSPEELLNTNWSRIHLFYTLFTAVAHCLYGLSGLDKDLRVPLRIKELGQARVCLDEISSRYDEISQDMDNPDAPKDYKQFIERSRRATTDTASRIERSNFVCKKLKEYMQQNMRTTPAKCLADLTAELKSLRKLDTLNQSQFSAGGTGRPVLTKTQLHVLTEAIFFAAFRSYEQFMRNVFVLYCCGIQPNRRKLVRPYLRPKTLKHTEELLQSSMPFLDWSSPDNVIERAETYLQDGYPVKNVISANVDGLRNLKRIRNHIAHMSKESHYEYLKTVRQHHGTNPLKVPRPGEFLLLKRTGSTTYYLTDYLGLIENVAKQLG